jgi:hypothetical protein
MNYSREKEHGAQNVGQENLMYLKTKMVCGIAVVWDACIQRTMEL